MVRALDNIENISTDQLKQRNRELNDELALASRKNIKLRRSIMLDRILILKELDRRNSCEDTSTK